MNINYRNLKKIFKRGSYERLLEKLILIGNEKRQIALSLAIGVAIGMIIPIGFQTVVAIPIALLLNCNLVLTVIGTLISNPFTLIPLYFISVQIGSVLTGITLSFDQVEYLIQNLDLDYFLKFGTDTLLVVAIGSIVQAVFYGLITYAVVIKVVGYYVEKKSKKGQTGD